MKNPLYLLMMGLGVLLVGSSCNKKAIDETDEEIYDALTGSGYVYYQGGNTLQAKGGSPHGPFKLKFNGTAQTVLNSSQELPTGSAFPNGSILVKELYSGTTLTLYVVMKKDDSNKYAEQGWLWAEYDTDGEVVYSVGKKGSSCISCHTATPNRDLVRTFDLH